MSMTDHNSYLSRHRPICTVIEEIKERIQRLQSVSGHTREEIEFIDKLCDEAKDYAQRMSNRLMEYKRKEVKDGS